MSPIHKLAQWSLIFSLALLMTAACEGQDSRPKKPAPKEGTGKDVEAEKGKDAEKGADTAIPAIREFIATQTAGDNPKINKKNPTWKTKLPKFPTIEFTKGKTYYWNLETSKGKVKVRLFPDVAPQHVTNFLYLTELGFFDDLSFHRVITGFMAQGGCPLGNGRGNPGYRFGGEFPKENGVLKQMHNRPGLLSMANAGAGTDGSQFFLTFLPTPHLDGMHTVFGETTEGLDTLKALEMLGSRSGRTSEPLKMIKATITVE